MSRNEWTSRALTALVEALREFELTPQEIAAIAHDLPGEYAATIQMEAAE